MHIKKSVLIILILLPLLLFSLIGIGVAVFFVGDQGEESNEIHFSESEGLSEDQYQEMLDELAESVNLPKVVQAFNLIESNYLFEVDETELIEGAIQGMLNALGDPYSEYLDPETMAQFSEQLESSFEGIGAEVSMINGVVTIVAPIRDSPAERAGLRPNDQVVTIDGESTEGLDLLEAVSLIRGERGTEVEIEIRRENVSELIPFTLVRDTIPLETVYPEWLEDEGGNVGYLQITTFAESTADRFLEELAGFEADGMDGLVIDVRGNPGGLLDVVQLMLQTFIPEDRPYMQMMDGLDNRERFFSTLEEEKDYPISILVDEGSASASEILAVSLQEAVDAQVVGVNSFGKGTVQTTLNMGDGSSIKLTILKWLSAEGNSIHEVGVEPDHVIEQPAYYYASPIQIEEPLTVDMFGDSVRFMQIMLNGLGYDVEREDGYFSQQTSEELERFQSDNDLDPTGELDTETAELIQTQIIENIREGVDDLQKQRAIEVLFD